jgi:hypothetical protein
VFCVLASQVCCVCSTGSSSCYAKILTRCGGRLLHASWSKNNPVAAFVLQLGHAGDSVLCSQCDALIEAVARSCGLLIASAAVGALLLLLVQLMPAANIFSLSACVVSNMLVTRREWRVGSFCVTLGLSLPYWSFKTSCTVLMFC